MLRRSRSALAVRQRLVLAGEVVVERPQRYPGQLGDGLACHGVEATLECELERGVTERASGVELLALPQAGHKPTVGETCTVGKFA